MFGNLINIYDFLDLYTRIVDKNMPTHLLALGRRKRTEGAWANRVIDTTEAMKPIQERFNRLISGDVNISRFDYATKAYLPGKRAVGVSFGSGSGEHELNWHAAGGFSRVDGYDLSPSRVAIANANASRQGLSDKVHYYCQDIHELAANPSGYDVVILESAMHHFSPLEDIIELIQRILRPGGLVFMCDFVGPSKFQWLPRQLEVTNALLSLLPEKYRVLRNGRIYNKRIVPSLARMYLMDPSEAIESSRILPLMQQNFDTLELKNAGGSILYHLFPRLIHNFAPDNLEDQRWLQFCIDIEDRFLEQVDEIGYWYVFGVYKVRK